MKRGRGKKVRVMLYFERKGKGSRRARLDKGENGRDGNLEIKSLKNRFSSLFSSCLSEEICCSQEHHTKNLRIHHAVIATTKQKLLPFL